MNKSKEVKDDGAKNNKTPKQDAVKRIHTLFDIAKNPKKKETEISHAKKYIEEQNKLKLKHELELANLKVTNLKAYIDQKLKSTTNDKTEFKQMISITKNLDVKLQEANLEIMRLKRENTYFVGVKEKMEESAEREKKTHRLHLNKENEFKGTIATLENEITQLKILNKKTELVLAKSLEEYEEAHKTVLQAQIEMLTYQNQMRDIEQIAPTCSICFENIFQIKADKNRHLRVTYCGHLVCDNDLTKWALSSQKGSCPACNQPLEGSVRFFF
jgi:DNA repair exonuclease SbcCD ATPase subunit